MVEEIIVGNAIENGEIQDEVRGVPYPNFLHSMIIAGEEGTGKSYFLASLLNEIYKSHPEVGVLVIRVSRRSPTFLIKLDDTVAFNNEDTIYYTFQKYYKHIY